MILFVNKMGSKIKKHVGVSTRGGVYDPLAGVTTLTLLVQVITPAIGSYTPPRTYLSVFLILIVLSGNKPYKDLRNA